MLYTVLSASQPAEIVAQSFGTDTRRTIVEEGLCAHYVEGGHLVYVRGDALVAVPFDAARLEVTGPAETIAEHVLVSPASALPGVVVARAGTLAYLPPERPADDRRLVWVDREGRAEPLPLPPGAYAHPRISPDGRRVAAWVSAGGEPHLVVLDLTSGRTSNPGPGARPVWTPDGKRLTYDLEADGRDNLYWRSPSGDDVPERLTSGRFPQFAESWSTDGRFLVLTESGSTTGRDVWVMSAGDRALRPLLRTAAGEGGAAISPDGRWLAYVSNETGRDEVYVAPFPGMGGRWQVSEGGGREPAWSRDGRELFFRNARGDAGGAGGARRRVPRGHARDAVRGLRAAAGAARRLRRGARRPVPDGAGRGHAGRGAADRRGPELVRRPALTRPTSSAPARP